MEHELLEVAKEFFENLWRMLTPEYNSAAGASNLLIFVIVVFLWFTHELWKMIGTFATWLVGLLVVLFDKRTRRPTPPEHKSTSLILILVLFVLCLISVNLVLGNSSAGTAPPVDRQRARVVATSRTLSGSSLTPSLSP